MVSSFGRKLLATAVAAGILASLPAAASGRPAGGPYRLDDAARLSSFGGRAAFSPDGKRIAFVDKSYGDAFELEIASGKMRKLTGGIPHQGVMRIQYLSNGDYLVTAPRRFAGVNTRAHLEMWVLDKNLDRALQPLGEQVFEGIAVSRKGNRIAWTVIEPELKPNEPWMTAFAKPTKRYVADVVYERGVAKLANKREVLATLPEGCNFIEPQDFRNDDRELVYSCMGPSSVGGFVISVMGSQIDGGETVSYARRPGEYNEVEGLAPDGSWATVECGKQTKPGLPRLDICRLELKPNGAMTPLIVRKDEHSDVSNPVVSPDGKWVAFQASENVSSELGEGHGLYLLKIAD